MTKKGKQRLCGGTFFTLLLQARKPRMGVRKHYLGKSDGLSDPSALMALTKVLVPDCAELTSSMMGTFKGNTSDFKSCKISSSAYLPFKDSAILSAFDNRIKTDYCSALALMSNFVSTFIDAGTSTKKDEYLVKALLELIGIDNSISDEQLFYVCEDGAAETKSSLLGESNFCLQSFLLGIWHFVLINVKDNKVGQATYDKWCPPSDGAERKYTATLGESITRPITVYACNVTETIVEAEIVDDDAAEEAAATEEKAAPEGSASCATQQIVNNNPTFLNFNVTGNNNSFYNQVDTVIIKNGG